LLQLIDINALNLLSAKRHLSGLNFLPETLKSRVLVISQLLTISSNYAVRCFQLCDVFWIVCKHSTVQLLFETNNDANIAAHLSIGQNVNDLQKLTGFVDFFYRHPWMISVGMVVISVV